ncbi:ATP-binding protein [Olsenella phocaeensis]|uniref:ATP-binding protein n=1 Tax=Olsenella phocaeensis TaxID=1852385 RepID=UPI000930FC57|nr:ATP-binding protein [Olsenella phocaeensis]
MPRYELSCGVKQTALKILVYGPEGLGKSTLAAEFPSPVFIDVEGGTNQLPVARLPRPTSWEMLLDEVRATRDGDVPSCSTLVVDTADAAEKLCVSHLCAKHGWDGIEGISYGKGYTYLMEEFGKLLDLLSEVSERGRNVTLVSHAAMRKFERPDESGAYDRFELKLTKKVAPMAKEWADMVLFCDYKTRIIKDKSGKAKATGGSRVIRTSHNPCWDAKNRFGFPEELPLELGKLPTELAEVIPDLMAETATEKKPAPKQSKSAKKAAKPKGQAAGTPAGDAYERPGYPARMSALADLMERDQVTDAELRQAVGQTGNFPEECDPVDYEQGYVDFLVSNWAPMLARVKDNRVDVPFD